MGGTTFAPGAAARIGGYALNNLWALCMFFNTVVFHGSTDPRAPLYLSFTVSVVALSATLALFPRVVRRPDRRVLSKPFAIGSGAAMGLSTILLAFADTASVPGAALLVTGGVLSGVASGVLFLGWMRLFTDLGTTVALVDNLLGWLGASLVDCASPSCPCRPRPRSP